MELINSLKQTYPEYQFVADSNFFWRPENKTIHFNDEFFKSNPKIASYSLIHELGHALSGHQNYHLDQELIQMELEAWQKAQQIAKDYRLTIPEEHIESCMESYRLWITARSRCPSCNIVGLQSAKNLNYSCLNCHKSWKVPLNQACGVKRNLV